MSTKITKMNSLRQQKKNRNQTIHILNSNTTKNITPTLVDKSINSIKNYKPEVQSSRFNRPQSGKFGSKPGNYYYMPFSKEKNDKITEMYNKGQKMSTKSLESKNGQSTNRKQTEKAKKNSNLRLHTEDIFVNQRNIAQLSQVMEQNLEKRLKTVEQIFKKKKQSSYHHSDSKIKKYQQNFTIEHKNTIETVRNVRQSCNMHAKTNSTNNVDSINNSFQDRQTQGSNRMLKQLNEKFQLFYQSQNERKNKMIFDEIDFSLSSIFKQIQYSFMTILDALTSESHDRMLDIEINLQNVIKDYELEIQKYGSRFEKMRRSYIEQIQNMLIKSLYVADKINILQLNGLIHFEKQSRKIDEDQLNYEESNYNENGSGLRENLYGSSNMQKNHVYLNSVSSYHEYDDIQSGCLQEIEECQESELEECSGKRGKKKVERIKQYFCSGKKNQKEKQKQKKFNNQCSIQNLR